MNRIPFEFEIGFAALLADETRTEAPQKHLLNSLKLLQYLAAWLGQIASTWQQATGYGFNAKARRLAMRDAANAVPRVQYVSKDTVDKHVELGKYIRKLGHKQLYGRQNLQARVNLETIDFCLAL